MAWSDTLDVNVSGDRAAFSHSPSFPCRCMRACGRKRRGAGAEVTADWQEVKDRGSERERLRGGVCTFYSLRENDEEEETDG